LPSNLSVSAIRAALEVSAGRVPAVTERMLRYTLDGKPVPRLSSPPPGVTARPGAVMALMYPRDDGLALALTERTAHLGNHAGQISLPGGRIEPTDISPWHAAVRETYEEIGVDLSGSLPWARLERIYVAASRFYVIAFVSYAPERPAFTLDPHEVASLVEVPLAVLMEEGTFRRGERDYEGHTILEGFFQFQSYKIWGATAVLLDQLVARINLGLELSAGS
jgi:8-oxo-dGTP pyrophosphatase MutT (NUDIX family)